MLATALALHPTATDAEIEARASLPPGMPPLVSLPPERQLHAMFDLEKAVYEAAGMIDLLMAKLIYEDRGGEIYHKEPAWLSNICALADRIGGELLVQLKRHWDEVRRLQDSSAQPWE